MSNQNSKIETGAVMWWTPTLFVMAPALLMGGAAGSTVPPGHILLTALIIALCFTAVHFAAVRRFGGPRAHFALTILVTTLWVAPLVHPLVSVLMAVLWGGVMWQFGFTPSRFLATALSAFSLFLVLPSAAQQLFHFAAERWQEQPAPPPIDPIEDLPDVWWIVLDGYSRGDVLAEHYGMAEGMAESLLSRGFFVGERSRSNYAQTVLSLSATLNMEPLETLISLDSASDDRNPLRELIRNSRLVSAHRAAGYSIVSYPSEYSPVSLRSDFYRIPWVYFTELEHALAERTLFASLMGMLTGRRGWLGHQIRRDHLSFTLSDLGRYRPVDGPMFTFAHITAPHPPFVFHPDGTPRPVAKSFLLSDGSHWRIAHGMGAQDYADGYRDLATWLQVELEAAVDRIMATGRPAVIVIHADHGGGSRLDWNNLDNTDLVERMAILNAVYFPDRDYSLLHDEISPIDTARAVMSRNLGAHLPLRDERSYFSLWETPFDLHDVTEQVRELRVPHP